MWFVCETCAGKFCRWSARSIARNLCDQCTTQAEKEDNSNDLQQRLAEQELAFTNQITELRETLAEREARLIFLQLQLDAKPRENSTGDVVFVVQDSTNELLYAHKFVLSSKSSVFRMIFNAAMLEKESGVVRIDDASLPVMRAVINYCYTAQIDFTGQVIPDEVLAVAHKYDIDLLQKECEKQLIKTIDKRNLPKRLMLSERFGAKGLQAAALKYFKEHFDNVFPNVLEQLCDHHTLSDISPRNYELLEIKQEPLEIQHEHLEIEPGELKFQFELRKQISRSLYLRNPTDNSFAFKVKLNSPKDYCVRPNKGIVLPHGCVHVEVIKQAQAQAPLDMRCKDKFLVQSVMVPHGTITRDLSMDPKLFDKAAGNQIHEAKIKVRYTSSSP